MMNDTNAKHTHYPGAPPTSINGYEPSAPPMDDHDHDHDYSSPSQSSSQNFTFFPQHHQPGTDRPGIRYPQQQQQQQASSQSQHVHAPAPAGYPTPPGVVSPNLTFPPTHYQPKPKPQAQPQSSPPINPPLLPPQHYNPKPKPPLHPQQLHPHQSYPHQSHSGSIDSVQSVSYDSPPPPSHLHGGGGGYAPIHTGSSPIIPPSISSVSLSTEQEYEHEQVYTSSPNLYPTPITPTTTHPSTSTPLTTPVPTTGKQQQQQQLTTTTNSTNPTDSLTLPAVGYFKDVGTSVIAALDACTVTVGNSAATRLVELKAKANELQQRRKKYHNMLGGAAVTGLITAPFTGGASLVASSAGNLHQRNRIKQVIGAMVEVLQQINQVREAFESHPRQLPLWRDVEAKCALDKAIFKGSAIDRSVLHGEL